MLLEFLRDMFEKVPHCALRVLPKRVEPGLCRNLLLGLLLQLGETACTAAPKRITIWAGTVAGRRDVRFKWESMVCLGTHLMIRCQNHMNSQRRTLKIHGQRWLSDFHPLEVSYVDVAKVDWVA